MNRHQAGEEGRIMKKVILTGCLVALVASVAQAERPLQPRADAKLVVTGTVSKVTPTESKYGGDGVLTNYVATVKVDKVEKGKGAKAGDTIKVTWFKVTKAPSRPLPGASGQAHALKGKDKARFWLTKGKGGWEIIYNKGGVEMLKE
jgi:hypothetical protein